MLTLKGKYTSITLLFLISVSLFGLMLAIIFAINPPKIQDEFAFRKPTVGSVLGVVCVLGILAVLYPDSCTEITDFKSREKTMHNSCESPAKIFRGHHAVCKPYSTHVIQIGNRVFCVTCSGLLVGAVVVLVGIGLFFFGNFHISEKPLLPVLVGAVGVLAGLFYPFMPPRFQNSYTRFFVGVLLAVGSFLILVGVEEATRSLAVNFFVVALSVLWLASKMSLSQWEHRRICARCSSSSCSAESIA